MRGGWGGTLFVFRDVEDNFGCIHVQGAAAAPSAPAATNVDFYSSGSASASLVSPPALLVGSPAGGSPITINRVYSLRSRDP